ncbi:MAG: ABC transporter ATP-binding protein [Chloroflexi bacterium]|nr:ABC transporter ATP-binding protein [Chloroflexota bacterium]
MNSAIIVENVWKRYRKGQTGYHTLREDLYNLTGRLLDFGGEKKRDADTEHIWALRDISFEVKPGERVGIIGRNGSGKTTLLRMLAGITRPNRGKIKVRGRLGVLIEIMAGFHPELTGRENIYLNGAIMGMSRKEIKRKFDEIVAFAELAEFIDTPIKRYSSGMHVRLGFAVAAHLDPDILLVDEVLAVGDAAFQKKCLGKMENSSQEGRTVLFVSHNLASVINLCPRAILLVAGGKYDDGPSSDIVAEYIETTQQGQGERIWNSPNTAPGNEKIRLHSVKIVSDGKVTSEVDIQKDVSIEIEFWNFMPSARIHTSIHLLDKMGYDVLASSNLASVNLIKDEWFDKPYPVGMYRSICTLPANFLNEGRYSINAIVLTDSVNFEVFEREVISFTVHDTGVMRKEYGGIWIGVVRPKLAWRTEYLEPLVDLQQKGNK